MNSAPRSIAVATQPPTDRREASNDSMDKHDQYPFNSAQKVAEVNKVEESKSLDQKNMLLVGQVFLRICVLHYDDLHLIVAL
jgi:hypothetical protein